MIIIGEKLNSSIPKTLDAYKNRDEQYVISLIKAQSDCGAEYLDINTALCGADEYEVMMWAVGLVTKHSRCNIVLDSPDPEVIARAAKDICTRKLIINSVTPTERMDELLPVIKEKKSGVVCMPTVQGRIPKTARERVASASEMILKLRGEGVRDEDIFIDVITEAAAVENEAARTAVDTVSMLKTLYPDVKTTCGASNISFGLPKRVNINCAFLCCAMFAGLDSAILDITNESVRTALSAAAVISGKDEYCLDYISYIRGDTE